MGFAILTRDVARYRTYFPEVELMCPQTDPTMFTVSNSEDRLV